MDKRQTIEKALMRLNEYMDGYAIAELASVIVESKQAIVIKCGVRHEKGWPGVQAHTVISFPDLEEYRDWLMFSSLDFPPDKALAIIISLEGED